MLFLSKLKESMVVDHAYKFLNTLLKMPIVETTVTTMTLLVTELPKLLLVVVVMILLKPKKLILMREMKNTIKIFLMPTAVLIV